MWEYKRVDIDSSEFETKANNYGREGWELVTVIYSPGGSWWTLLFKRKIG